jgi:Tfp pilus assembly protein PilN
MSQNINLFDSSLRERRDWLSFEIVASVTMVVTVLTVSAGIFLRVQSDGLEKRAAALTEEVKTQQEALVALTQEVTGAKPDPQLVAELARAQNALAQRRAVLQALQGGSLGNDAGYSPVLRALARQTMPGVWLTGVSIDHRDIALRGRALRPDAIPDYMGRLERESSLQGRSFRALDIQRPVDTMAGPQPVSAQPGTPPRLAAFVEFALIGAEGKAAPGIGKEGGR